MIPVTRIAYFDGNAYVSGSEAVVHNLIKAPKIHITYESGLHVYSNLSHEAWKIDTGAGIYQLPVNGFLAYLPGSNLLVYSAENEQSETNSRIERVYSGHLFFLDTHGETVGGDLAGKGSYMLKKEKFGWEIIPVGDLEIVDFSLSLPGFTGLCVDVQAIDRDGMMVNLVNEDPMKDRVCFRHDPQYFKYVICPVSVP
jgi:hypothetical protein